MALPTANKGTRGSALVEAIAVSSLLIALVTTLLTSAYFIFARGWIEYQSEQALFCLMEARFGCRSKFEQNVRRFLPWGELKISEFSRGPQKSKVEVRWQSGTLKLQTQKILDLKSAARSKALRW